MEWVGYVVSVLPGIVICITLIYKLIEYVRKAVMEKNWGQLLTLVMQYMEEAEEKFTDGATKKEWVMGMVETSAGAVNYPVDMAVVSKMIDDLCAMSKEVNYPAKAETVWQMTAAVEAEVDDA